MTKHTHYATIQAWAAGAAIEMQDEFTCRWHEIKHPQWWADINYRVKPVPKPDIVHEALISLSFHAGPLLHAASPLDANCVLVFDGETGKLKEASFKQPQKPL